MLKQYFVYRSEFPKELYGKALELFADGKNPFLYILENMNACIKGTNYHLSSEVFGYSLENDRLSREMFFTLEQHFKNCCGVLKFKMARELLGFIKRISLKEEFKELDDYYNRRDSIWKSRCL